MSDTLRHKILLWLVLTQIALIASAVFMIEHTHVWRLNVPFWTLLIGYILGFVLSPLSRGVEKSKLLKWWLKIDLVITILMFIPAYYTLSACYVKYVSDRGKYVLYHRGGPAVAPAVSLGVKSGLFIDELRYIHLDYWRITDKDWEIDDKTGCCWLKSMYNTDTRLYVCPIDSAQYSANAVLNCRRIDSLYYLYAKKTDVMDFVLPNDFSRVVYKDSASVSYFKTDDDYWYPSVEIIYTSKDRNISPDSMIIRFKDSTQDRDYHKDSITRMPPTQVQKFITQLKECIP